LKPDICKDLLIFSLIFLVFLCVSPISSRAHALPDHSDPKVGATVKSSPTLVRIWFNSDLKPALSKLSVRDSNDKVIDKHDSRVDPDNPRLLEVSIPKLPPGQYRVIWSVVAGDGHRTVGDFCFKVKEQPHIAPK